MNIKLETMLSQQQQVSQKLIQSVNILQMSAEELDGWLAEMSLGNSVMELTKKQPEEYGQKNAEKYQWISSHDEQNRYLYQKIETDEDDMQDWDPGPGEGESLQEHLREELLTLHIVPEEEVYYYYLIDSLDYRGYYTDSLDDFAAKFGLEEETARNMLENIQKLDAGSRSQKPQGMSFDPVAAERATDRQAEGVCHRISGRYGEKPASGNRIRDGCVS